jgi:hypothetical protein
MRNASAAVIVAFGLVGCAADGGDVNDLPVRVGAPAAVDLRLWAHDPELEELADQAALRIEAASGLTVAVNDEMVDAMPMFWSESGVGYWQGLRTRHKYEYIAIATDTNRDYIGTVVLHEMMHALGAEHLDATYRDMLMSPNTGGNYPIRTADLEALCSVAACRHFAPEAE